MPFASKNSKEVMKKEIENLNVFNFLALFFEGFVSVRGFTILSGPGREIKAIFMFKAFWTPGSSQKGPIK